jgi:hypothetical protein
MKGVSKYLLLFVEFFNLPIFNIKVYAHNAPHKRHSRKNKRKIIKKKVKMHNVTQNLKYRLNTLKVNMTKGMVLKIAVNC